MYISEIDDILDQTIDKFMYTWIIESKAKDLLNFADLAKEANFVKFQKQINKILEFGMELISQTDVTKIVTKNNNILLVNNLVSKYLAYYLFILMGINYGGKIESFNNNLIEFSRNQSNYSVKINNFFNSESNSGVIKTINLITEFNDYVNKLKSKKVDTANLINSYSSNFKEFIELYGNENVSRFIELTENKEISKNKIILDHNIVKIMIFIYLYRNTEKKDVFNEIESSETANGEFIFIDVVVPRSLFIDYNAIESILHPTELKTSLPDIIYNLVNDDYTDVISDNKKYYTDHDLKIQKLLDTHIIIPIVDDFLLYHKDNEKYEKQGDKMESPKKKDETKIKYIISKINTASDVYKNEEEIRKLFYVPLQNRDAILTNTYEDIKILSKMKNIIKMNVETADLFNDLINYRMYPYIAFKEFKKNGFVFSSDNTHDAIRNINFSNMKKRRSDMLQTRIISSNMLVNIVGFAIVNKNDQLQCLDLNNFIDISKESKDPLTTFKVLMEEKIKNTLVFDIENSNDKKTKRPSLSNNYFWLFDAEKDNYSVPFYDISPKMPKSEVIKIVSAYLYDYMIETVINIIKDNIEDSHPKNINDYMNNFNKYRQALPDIDNIHHANDVNELEYLIYYVKSIKTEDLYDYNEDLFPGLYGKIYKLPSAPAKELPPIPKVKFITDFRDTEKKDIVVKTLDTRDFEINDADYETTNYINGVCQHIISWDKISEIKKTNTSMFSNLVYEFIQQYVEISASLENICKSCRSAINIKKYIMDGSFDDSTQTFVTFSIHMDINIEDLPEYEKFKTSIRNIDKIIERFASIINIQGLIGNTGSIRTRRKGLVKDTMDLLLNHNNFLKKNYQTQRDKLVASYGINKKLSNLFIFELDNSIFIYSSKEKDLFKILKYNNVLTYILILLVLELNDTQILNFFNDKICSYAIFKKIGHSLFEGLNIYINKSYDLKPLKNYPVLCYVIYLTSCFITKYNLWGDTMTPATTPGTPATKQKFNPLIQKTIIQTFVELLNTILHVEQEEIKKNKIYLYEILITKFFLKLELFKDFNLIKKLDKMYLYDDKIITEKRSMFDTDKFDSAPPKTFNNSYTYDESFDKMSRKFCLERYNPPVFLKNLVTMDRVSNLSNCIEGEFHKFKTKGTNMECDNCHVLLNLDSYIPDSYDHLHKLELINYMKKLAKKYCITGKIHNFDYNSENDNNVCRYCSYREGDSIKNTEPELYKMYNTIQETIINNNILAWSILNKNNLKNENEAKNIKKCLDKIMYKFQKYDNNLNNTLDTLLDNIQKLLGTDIMIDNKLHNLHNNIYIIDHDFNGSKLSAPVQINEKDNRFRFVENHPFFKRDVLVYTLQKNTKYESFYDAYDKYLLGFREVNKEFNIVEKTNAKILVNYSLKNIFMLLGFTRQFVDVKDYYPEIYGYTGEELEDFKKKFKMNELINKVGQRRFNIIKKLGAEINTYVNRFKFNYQVKIIETPTIYDTAPNPENEPINNPFDIIYNKFQKKLDTNVITSQTDKNITHLFLKYMTVIQTYMPFIKIKETVDYSTFLDFNVVVKHDYSSNLVLNYIIDEINRLINYNTNKVVKTNLVIFIIEIAWKLFNLTNYNVTMYDRDVSFFNQILYSSDYYLETQNQDMMMDAIDFYGTTKDVDNMSEEQREKHREAVEDDIEEDQAIDWGDEEIDAEGLFDLNTKPTHNEYVRNMFA
jgi:hypothetical protein